MKAAWKRTAAGILLWSALAVLGAARQADGSGEWSAWKGTPAPWKSPAEAERTVADYRAWLAELRVKLMTGRTAELPGWEERLETIRLHATSASGLPAQRELLVEVTRARAQALATQGRFDEARAAVDAVLFAPGDPAAAKLALVIAPPALVELAQTALADPALEEVRSDLAPTAQAGPAQEDGLDERLRTAVAAGKFDLLKQVGARAAPVLEQAVAENLEYLPEATVQDPFAVLVEVNQRRAAAFALAHVDAGASFRLRVVRAMEGLEVLRDSPSAWESTKLAGPRAAVVPEWLGVLARLLGYRDSAGNALGLVGQVISADGLTPEVTRALTDALQGKDGDVVPELMESLSLVEPGKESAEELFEFLLQHEDPRVRRVAAQHLTELGDLPALLERADDPDVLVRRMVALAIGAEGKRAAPASWARTQGSGSRRAAR